ncbi:GGDEF domain-containing protein [Sulfurirhabdus autotrophica]|uniref:diguanylate cyclase n=1 Tax=Sulfurirhabdus autotrophica TaxID=1706046 RepID=A0A4R3XW98_9PROT|nr:GGDEF domain-containing protein [Sulfurirhabdus autotrophica]TCV83282.1 diguanylate cyclase (GGDEF)-like protein [Sulfurirhabdus autotrophica]
MVELLKQNLVIEPDIQNFMGFVLLAVKSLGGNQFSATSSCLQIVASLRLAGAGTGLPLPVTLLLEDSQLTVHFGQGVASSVVDLKDSPEAGIVEQLRLHLQQSTEIADPALLLRRNAEMIRHLDETRIRTEKEIEIMQQTLAKRQEELGESIRNAETDPLTGLLNRRAYDERLSTGFQRTLRQRDEVLSLILFDLDFFKQINDEHGHQYGDAYLIKMAQAMLHSIRDGVDHAIRFGGDEFAILLYANKDIACNKAMHVLSQMNNKVSIGIASLSADEPGERDMQNFIHRADVALYEAKRAGRGRVVVDTWHPDGSITWAHFLPDSK